MTVPQAGSLDQVLTIGGVSAGAPEPAQSLLGRTPAGASALGVRIADVAGSAGKSVIHVLFATYSAPAHSAELTVHGIADDPAKACSLTGTLTETG